MAITEAGEETDVELLGGYFYLEFDNGITGYFTDVSGLSIDVTPITEHESQGRAQTSQIAGQTTYGDLTVKRQFQAERGFWDWVSDIRDGSNEYRTHGAIVITDRAGDEVGRWSFTNAWPSKWSITDLDVGSDTLLEEEVTLKIEGLERVS